MLWCNSVLISALFRALNTSGTSVSSADVDGMKQNKGDIPISGWCDFGQELSIRK